MGGAAVGGRVRLHGGVAGGHGKAGRAMGCVFVVAPALVVVLQQQRVEARQSGAMMHARLQSHLTPRMQQGSDKSYQGPHLRSNNHFGPVHSIYLLFIRLEHVRALERILPKHIDLRARKLARRDVLLEQQIELREAAALGLRQPEERVDDAEEARARPEETGVVAPVPFAGVEHVRREHRRQDADDVVQVAAQHDRLDRQPARRQLGHERVAHRADRELVEQGPHQHHHAGRHGACLALARRDEAEEAHDEEHGAETAETVEVERSSSDTALHQEPRAEDTAHVDAVLAHGEVVGSRWVESGLLQEVRRVSGEGVAAQVLDSPGHADNLSAAQINALEAVHVGGALGNLLFQSSGVHHHGNCLFGIKVRLAVQASESEERLLRVFETALADEPPWALGCQKDADHERHRPHPLQSVGDAVRPLVLAVDQGANHTYADELTETPAEVDVVSAQRNRTHLARVGNGKRLEHAPRDTTQNLRDQKMHNRLRREENGGKADDQEQTPHNRIPVPNGLTNPAIQKQPNNLTDNNTITQPGLPRRRNLPRPVRQLLAVLLLELRKPKEVVQQTHVVALHDNARADQHRPANRLGVQLDALPQRHLVLFLSRLARVVDDLVRGALAVRLVVFVQRLRAARGLDVRHGAVTAKESGEPGAWLEGSEGCSAHSRCTVFSGESVAFERAVNRSRASCRARPLRALLGMKGGAPAGTSYRAIARRSEAAVVTITTPLCGFWGPVHALRTAD
ncbi:hypothetical protein OPT61_g7795 [Boeremia exigua]|uniref:Uncharacterized protein n=1 Tax=Boeremia exigua TaxID=749465 RepID=A0ACC2I223_9PLEO|nr:hypothetical protein OPT61_g7795 [Boeremia exigua]